MLVFGERGCSKEKSHKKIGAKALQQTPKTPEMYLYQILYTENILNPVRINKYKYIK